MKLDYKKELDGVRATAAIMVMLFHYFQSLKTQNEILLIIKKIAVFGQTGVTLFFVLSGYLITRILISKKGTAHYFRNFYIRRSLRIFPLYYGFLLVFYFVNSSGLSDLPKQLWYWIYMQDFAFTFNWEALGPGHYWSLAIEEHFYLIWPLLIYFNTPKRLIIVIFFIVFSSAALRYLLLKNGFGVYYFTFTRWDDIAFGSLLGIIESLGLVSGSSNRKFLGLFSITLIFLLPAWLLFENSGALFLEVLKYPLIAIVYFAIIGFIISSVRNKSYISSLLTSRMVTYLGLISYGLYVYHPLCFALSRDALVKESEWIIAMTGFLSTIILATISYSLIEVRFLRLKNHFT